MPIDTGGGGDSGSPGLGGSGPAAPAFGGGGASALGVPGATTADSLGNLRAMLKKRFVGTGAPGYATPAAPAPTAMVPPSGGMTVGGLQAWQTGAAAAPAPPAPAPAPPSWGTLNQSGGNVPKDVNLGAGFLGTLNDIIRNFLGSGAYSDQPNQAILDAVRAKALSDAGAARDHTVLAAESMGTDPATAASYALQSGLQGQGDVANAVNNATYGEMTHQRDYGQQLLELLLGRQGAQNQYNPQGSPWSALIQSLGGIGAV